MPLLIYDSSESTHLFEFCEYILGGLLQKEENQPVYFLLNDKVEKFLIEKFALEKKKIFTKRNIIIHSIPDEYQNQFNNCNNVLYLSYLEEKFVNNYCIKNHINEVIFLQIDTFQIILGLRKYFNRKNIFISGILLSPYSFYPPNLFFLRLRKYFQIQCLLHNKYIQQIFILNDLKSVDNLNNNHSTKIFSLLVDPIKKREVSFKDYRKDLNIHPNEFVFLILGGIGYRKNIHSILMAFDLLPINLLSSIKLIISGKTHDIEYAKKIKQLVTKKIANHIVFIDHFLSMDELEALVDCADALFTVYIDFYSSSGVVGNASKHFKPLIASNTGVIGRIVKEYSLGITVNPNSVIDISLAIIRLFENNKEFIKNARFDTYNIRNNYLEFAEKLLSKHIV